MGAAPALVSSSLTRPEIAPVGYCVYALALGVAAEVIIMRTMPAMAVTVAVFLASRFSIRALRANFVAQLKAPSSPRLPSKLEVQLDIILPVRLRVSGSPAFTNRAGE